jgi:hypothetical protein
LLYFYNSIKDVNKKLVNDTQKNLNSNLSVMLSFFKNSENNTIQKIRKEIYMNNINSNWLFFEANPLARYRIGEFNIDNEFIRVCLDNQYHSHSRYIKGNKDRWNMILNKTGITVEPWRKKGSHILFILNSCVKCGYSMRNVNIHEWVNKKIKIIRESGCKRKNLIRLKCGGQNKKNVIITFHIFTEEKK